LKAVSVGKTKQKQTSFAKFRRTVHQFEKMFNVRSIVINHSIFQSLSFFTRILSSLVILPYNKY